MCIVPCKQIKQILAGSWENDIGINEIVMRKELLIQIGGESKDCTMEQVVAFNTVSFKEQCVSLKL